MLNVSHAAISQQVRALEADLGVQLVDRSGRRTSLTTDGAQLAQSLERAFSSIYATISELRVDNGRPLQVTLTPSFGMRWLMPRISDFRHRNPEVEIMLNPTVDIVDLAPGGVDVAIRFGNGRWAGLDAEMLLPTSFAIVGAKSLVGSTSINEPRDILGLPWLQEYGTNEMTSWLRNQGVVSLKSERIIHMPGFMLLDALMNGEGISVVAQALVEKEIESGALVVLFEDTDDTTGYHIVTRRGVLRPATRAFVHWLRQQSDPEMIRRTGDRLP